MKNSTRLLSELRDRKNHLINIKAMTLSYTPGALVIDKSSILKNEEKLRNLILDLGDYFNSTISHLLPDAIMREFSKEIKLILNFKVSNVRK